MARRVENSISQVFDTEPTDKEERRKIFYKKSLQRSLRDTPYSVGQVKRFTVNDTIYDSKNEIELADDFGPQFGFSDIRASFDAIDFVVNQLGITCSDDLAREIEGVSALYFVVVNSSNLMGALAGIVLYVRQRFSTSLTVEILRFIQDSFGVLPQSGDDTSSRDPEWLQFMKDIQKNWKQAQVSPLFANFTRIMSLLVITGLYSVSDLTFSIGEFKVLEPNCKLLCGGASDIVNAVTDIVVFFCERVYHSYKSGSFVPFMHSDMETADLELDFANLESDWSLYSNGNLQKVANKDPQDFLVAVANMEDRLRDMIVTATGLDKRLLEGKYRRCLDISNGITMIRANSSFRKAPCSFEYYGKSGVGKTSIAAQTSRVILASAGLPTSDLYKYNHVSGREFWDGCKSDVVEIKIDDHANTKAEFVKSSPCDDIIRINNNMPHSPNMAELTQKGKVWIEPELFTLTTNVEDLDARKYSNNPGSIQRRMHVIAEIDSLPEFTKYVGGKACGIDSAKVLAHNAQFETPPIYDDVWQITVKETVLNPKETSAAHYRIVEHNGKLLEKIDMKTWLAYATERFHKHRAEQEAIYQSMGVVPKLEKCPVEGCIHIKECCPLHKNEPQWGLENVRGILTQSTDSLYREATSFYETWDWLPYLPEYLVTNKFFGILMCGLNGRSIINTYKSHTKCNALFVILMQFVACGFTSGLTLLLLVNAILCVGVYYQYWLISRVREEYHNQLISRNTLNLVHKRWRDNIGKAIMSSCAALGTIYLISKAYKYFYGNFAQGNLEPRNESDLRARDAEPNVWASVAKRPLPSTQKSIEHTTEVVDKKVLKNLFYATFEGEDGRKRMGNVLFIDSNMLLAPDHYFVESKSKTIGLTCYKEKAQCLGGMFFTRIDLESSYLIPDTDLRVCYSPSGGSFGNLIDYFPTGKLVDHGFHMFWRAKNGDLTRATGYAEARRTTNGVSRFDGGVYLNLSIDTFKGLCGGVLISDNKQTCITGLHLGGVEGTNKGCFGTLTGDQLRDAIDKVKSVPGVLKTGTEGEFKPQFMDKSILTHGELHPKSPVNYLPEGSQYTWFGTCVGATSFRSDVRKTPISDVVSCIMGQDNIWGKPHGLPEWKPWQVAMANSSHPAKPVPHSLLQKSVEDYIQPLLELASSDLWCKEKPLTDHENLCGKPGVKFIDAIQLNTSAGFPLTGPKRKFVVELEPTPERPNNREFVPELMEVIRECEEKYRQGVRNHFVAKACKKDEILPVEKEKCRIFFANNVVLTYLVRKFFLPICRFIQMNPLLSECAVGVNCHGPEWQQLHDFVFTHGEDRLIGGDYGKYDQKLPSQKLNAAISILIRIAKCMNYSEEDITIMEAMAGDIVYSLIAFNGDLLGIQSGTHISGNSLTVILNGISGSLNLRDYFFTQYDSDVKFRDAVALLTYGDDNIGSVKEGFDKFNIEGASKFLEEYGQIYTMPDKESELQPFLNKEDFEFLKRTSVYHPKLGCNIGALAEKSIFKSLHCYLRPKNAPLTPSEACAQNIDTSLREWFNHGEDVFESRRQQLNAVAESGGLAHLCTMLDVTYDDAVADWKHKYAGGPKPEREIEVFEVQSYDTQDCL